MIVGVVFHVVLDHTRFGYDTRAVGGNAKAALANGVRVGRVSAALYVTSAAVAALGGIRTDDRLESRSMREFVDTPVFDRAQAQLMWDRYLGSDRSAAPPYAAPMRATTLAGLPPAYVLTAEWDPLRDEGLAYALRLLADGVDTELHAGSTKAARGTQPAPRLSAGHPYRAGRGRRSRRDAPDRGAATGGQPGRRGRAPRR